MKLFNWLIGILTHKNKITNLNKLTLERKALLRETLLTLLPTIPGFSGESVFLDFEANLFPVANNLSRFDAVLLEHGIFIKLLNWDFHYETLLHLNRISEWSDKQKIISEYENSPLAHKQIIFYWSDNLTKDLILKKIKELS